MDAEAIAVLVSTHEAPASRVWERMPDLEVRGLDDVDAHELAARSAPGAGEAVIRRTVSAAGGNPLALRELPGVLCDTDPHTPALPVGPSPVGPRLRRAFTAQVEGMAPAARTLLLLAAAEDRGRCQVVRQAGVGLGVDPAAWEQALRSGLLSLHDDRLRFRHSLVRAAVYDEAALPDRQAAHLALAEAVTGDEAEELRAWHLAAAAEGPDGEVARLLEHAADRAWARGGAATAVQALRRAALLSPVAGDATRRLARGAQAAWEAGQAATARTLLQQAEQTAPTAVVAGFSGGLRGVIEFVLGEQERAHQLLLRDMRVVAEPATALELGYLAVRAAWSAGRSDLQAEALQDLAALAREEHATGADLLPVLRSCWTGDVKDPTDGPAAAAPTEDALIWIASVSGRLIPPAPLGMVWGMESALSRILRPRVHELRQTDAVGALAQTLAQTATLDVVQGMWGRAEENASEALRLAEEIGADHTASQAANCLGWLAAMRGDEAATEAAAVRILRVSVPGGVRALSATAYWSLGQSALFAGRTEEALERLSRLTEPGHDAAHPTFAVIAALDTVESAVHAGRPEAAEQHARLLRQWSERSRAPWAVSGTYLADALLAQGGDVERSFRLALDVPGAQSRPFTYARTRLLYGEWLRRARRRTDARIQLAEAAQTFQRLHATPLLERALREQELTGQQPHRDAPVPGGANVLTPQELRVARLAGQGLTNKEIAAQLLISPRTVGHHLANVFPKIGITSRADLARVDFEDGLRLTG